jgi:IS5 family transposase
MFETLFSDVLKPDHELIRAAYLMVGIHILKHRYNCSDEHAVEMLHENAYWQCFCGFNTFQKGEILDATSLVKFLQGASIFCMNRMWRQSRRVSIPTRIAKIHGS